MYPVGTMNTSHSQPKIHLSKSPDYRETYANSVQIRVSVWDFFSTSALFIKRRPIRSL